MVVHGSGGVVVGGINPTGTGYATIANSAHAWGSWIMDMAP